MAPQPSPSARMSSTHLPAASGNRRRSGYHHRWFPGVRFFSSKGQRAEAQEANADALLAFPSEVIGRGQSAPVADIADTETPRSSTSSRKFVRAVSIIGAVVILVGLGALLIQRYLA